MLKRIVAFITVFTVIFTCVPLASFASERDSEFKFKITKTGIKAGSVLNSGGYGSLKKNSNAALIDSEGNIVADYRYTPYQFRVDGDCVTLAGDSRTEFISSQIDMKSCLYKLENGQLKEISTELKNLSPVGNGYALAYTSSKKGEDYRSPVLINSEGAIVYAFSEDYDMALSSSSFIEAQYAYVVDNYNKGNYWFGWFSEGLVGCGKISYTEFDRTEDDDWPEDYSEYDYDGNVYHFIKYNREESTYYDIDGQAVLTVSGYDEFYPFFGGLAGVEKGSLYGFIDKSGSLVIPCQYTDFYEFRDGVAAVCKDNKWGCINQKGETIIPFEYDDARWVGDHLAIVGKDGKYGAVDYNNKLVLPIEYDDLSSFVNGVSYGIKDEEVYIIKIENYEDPKPHIHNLVATPAKEATVDSSGNSAYWTCTGCGKYFSDSEGTKEISEGSWIIPKKSETQPASIKISSIKISGISRQITAGRKIKLTATVLPKNATNKKITWSSSNKKLATVTQSGLVKIAKKAKPGKTVTIIATATDGSNKKAAYKITVMKGAVKKITVKGAKKTLKVGKTMKLKATLKVTKGKPVNKKLKWTSSNPKYATVTQTGRVKALKAGKGKTVKIKAMSTDGTNKSVVKKIKIN